MDIFIRDDYDEVVKARSFLPLHIAKKIQPCRIDNLSIGDRFEIPSLEEIYRNLYLVGLSDCSATIKGEYRQDKDDPFKALPRGYTISLSTLVKRV